MLNWHKITWIIHRTNLNLLDSIRTFNNPNLIRILAIDGKYLFCHIDQYTYSLAFELKFYIRDDTSENDIYELTILIAEQEGQKLVLENCNPNSKFSNIIRIAFIKYLIYYLYFQEIKINQMLGKIERFNNG